MSVKWGADIYEVIKICCPTSKCWLLLSRKLKRTSFHINFISFIHINTKDNIRSDDSLTELLHIFHLSVPSFILEPECSKFRWDQSFRMVKLVWHSFIVSPTSRFAYIISCGVSDRCRFRPFLIFRGFVPVHFGITGLVTRLTACSQSQRKRWLWSARTPRYETLYASYLVAF